MEEAKEKLPRPPVPPWATRRWRLPHEVGDDLASRVLDDGTLGNGAGRGSCRPVRGASPPCRGAVAGPLVRGSVIAQQGRHPRVDSQDDVAAMTAVAAVGPGQGLELLTVHGGAAVAAVAAGHVEDHSVNEAGHGVSCESGIAREGGRQVPSASRDVVMCSGLRPRGARR